MGGEPNGMPMRLSPPSAAILPALLLLAGCATVVRGPSEVLRFASTPSGARVQLSNGQGCEATPCRISVPRSADVTATFSRFNCESAQVQIVSQISRLGAAGMAGNAVIPTAGVVGLAVDGASGAARSLSPNPVEARLRCFATVSAMAIPEAPAPEGPPPPAGPTSFTRGDIR